MSAKVTVFVETNGHCGYCSGTENEYKCKVKIFTFPLPKQYGHLRSGDTISPDEYSWESELDPYSKKLDFKVCGDYSRSGYCDNDKDLSNGLEGHDYRLTIREAIVI